MLPQSNPIIAAAPVYTGRRNNTTGYAAGIIQHRFLISVSDAAAMILRLLGLLPLLTNESDKDGKQRRDPTAGCHRDYRRPVGFCLVGRCTIQNAMQNTSIMDAASTGGRRSGRWVRHACMHADIKIVASVGRMETGGRV